MICCKTCNLPLPLSDAQASVPCHALRTPLRGPLYSLKDQYTICTMRTRDKERGNEPYARYAQASPSLRGYDMQMTNGKSFVLSEAGSRHPKNHATAESDAVRPEGSFNGSFSNTDHRGQYRRHSSTPLWAPRSDVYDQHRGQRNEIRRKELLEVCSMGNNLC